MKYLIGVITTAITCLPIGTLAFSIAPAHRCYGQYPQRLCPSKSRVRMMGRAENRRAKKRKNKSGKSGVTVIQNADKLPKGEVKARLNEVPVFGLRADDADISLTETGWLAGGDGTALFFTDLSEARLAKQKIIMEKNMKVRVEGVLLGNIWWDRSAMLKPSRQGLRGMTGIPKDRTMDPNIRVPIYGIDGLAVANKDTNENCIPLFFDKEELFRFAADVYGSKAKAEEMVMVTDLGACVDNMLQGPAGPLRDAKFFAEAVAIEQFGKLEQTANQGDRGGGGLGLVFPGSDEFPGGLFPGR